MAVAPQLAPDIAKKLSGQKLCADPKRTRIVFEKPFGHDLESAQELNKLLAACLKKIRSTG
jgi:glucose-6-phosphate 1-dehydrogenase